MFFPIYLILFCSIPFFFEGLSEKEAIAQGDSAVRMTQSSGSVKDLADIQGREDVFYKVFTKFYSYFFNKVVK